jgi:hypothetical protein
MEETEVITWEDSYYTVDGGEINIVDGGYSDDGNTLEIKCKDIKTDIYLTLPEFEEYDAGDKVHLSFRLNPVGMVGGYSSFELCSWGGSVIDYAYEYNVWNWVNYDATILEINGQNTVLLSFNKALREKVKISETAYTVEQTNEGWTVTKETEDLVKFYNDKGWLVKQTQEVFGKVTTTTYTHNEVGAVTEYTLQTGDEEPVVTVVEYAGVPVTEDVAEQFPMFCRG